MSIENIKNATTEIICVFLGDEGSDLYEKGQEIDLTSKGLTVTSATVEEAQSISEDAEEKISDEGFAIFQKTEEGLKCLEAVSDIDADEDWQDAFSTYAENMKKTEADDEGYYFWGQKVPTSGDYLCKDCGVVLDLEEGSYFPICETCLDGLPEGPSGPGEAFWELI